MLLSTLEIVPAIHDMSPLAGQKLSSKRKQEE